MRHDRRQKDACVRHDFEHDDVVMHRFAAARCRALGGRVSFGMQKLNAD
jgi:hypothetical protein